MYPTVTITIEVGEPLCNRITVSKPSTPPNTMIAATTTNATILVASPSPQPSRPKTVAVANVASATKAVS